MSHPTGRRRFQAPSVRPPETSRWEPGQCETTGSLAPVTDGAERLEITSWGPVRCEPPDGSPPLPGPLISPRGPGEERAETRWEPGQCETTGGFPPALAPVTDGAERLGSLLLGRQVLGGLVSPKSLSPEASRGRSGLKHPVWNRASVKPPAGSCRL